MEIQVVSAITTFRGSLLHQVRVPEHLLDPGNSQDRSIYGQNSPTGFCYNFRFSKFYCQPSSASFVTSNLRVGCPILRRMISIQPGVWDIFCNFKTPQFDKSTVKTAKQDPYTNFSLLDSFWFALIFWCSFFLVPVGLYWCQDQKRRFSLLSNQWLVPLTPGEHSLDLQSASFEDRERIYRYSFSLSLFGSNLPIFNSSYLLLRITWSKLRGSHSLRS